jgi:predicted metal-dependent phosphoesterase TrpH
VNGLNIDLHTHSSCSDGCLSPAELVELAAAAGVEVLALTDHDTVAGLDDAQRAAAALGVKLVPGVEISASWRAQAIHVLGLWIDPTDAALRAMLEAQTDLRRVRIRKICARLEKLKLPGAELLATVEQHGGVPTRAHLAQGLLALGCVASPDAAFRRYLGKGRPAHVATQWPSLESVVGWIRAAGGVASLAHPSRYSLSAGARRRLLGDFAAAGGTALEFVSSGNGAQQVEACAMLAASHGLSGSVGSDFHSPQAAWNPLGRSLNLPDWVTPVWRRFGL